MDIYDSPEYKRSRGAYIVQCAMYYLVTLLVTDAFLAKLLGSIGIKDSLIGIISSFVSLAFLIQLFSIFLLRLKVSRKRLVITLDTIGICFFMLLYLVPFIPVSTEIRTVLVIVSVVIAYAGNYLISTICFKWANSYVDPEKRGSFSSTKEIFSLASGIIFTIIIGYIIDRYEGIGNQKGGFLFIAITILILNMSNIICYAMIKKEDGTEQKKEEHPMSEIFKNVIGNKNYRNVIVLSIMLETAKYFTIGFMGIFKTKDLVLSVFAVQVINMAANIIRILVSKPLGKYADKHSYAKGIELGLYILGAGFLLNMFTTKSTWFLVVLFTILYNCSQASTNQNSFNITYNYVDYKYISQAMAIRNSIAGICGFAASIIAGKILGIIQANENQVFGVHIYGQQLLSAISLVIVVIAILFTKKVIEKQKVIIQ